LLDALPASDLVGEDVVRPLDGAKLHDFRILKDRAGRAAADRAYARMGGSGQARVPFFADERVPMLNTPGMRAAAVDLGKVRVGLAVADELGLMAHPRQYLDGRDQRRVVAELARLAVAEGITLFVIGLPRQLNGKEGLAAGRARRFAEQLAKRTQARVELVDEWLSTVEAHARLREQGTNSREARERVDSAAAAVLLQSWLDGQRAPRDPEEHELSANAAERERGSAGRDERHDSDDELEEQDDS
jgi:putative Holliday junction resolvase